MLTLFGGFVFRWDIKAQGEAHGHIVNMLLGRLILHMKSRCMRDSKTIISSF